MINWKVRIKNKNFWLALIPALLLLIQAVAYVFGFSLDLSELGDKLAQTARLRVENPELTLTQLAELCDPPVTKSCLNHRLRKLCELAERLREEQGAGQ